MSKQADVVSAARMLDGLEKALPHLESMASLESTEEGTGDLLSRLRRSLPVIQKEPEAKGVMVTFRDPTSAQLQSFLAEQAPAANKVDEAEGGGLEAKFDSHDILGWFGSFFTWWRKIKPHAWLPGDAEPAKFPDVARVALMADWGTGMYGAPVCARSIEKDKAGYNLIMHLGDVYYSGTGKEMADRFLNQWPKVAGAMNRGLNGNHEMYTGGQSYFADVLPKFGQKASYFALQSNHWVLGCLDTAYADHDLAGDQAAWLTKIINEAGGRKVVLFSHHQPYSILDSQGPKLVEKLGPLLNAGKIHAWYWGHEHHCVVYKKHAQWGLMGRCIGHSGFPEFRKPEWGGAPTKASWVELKGANGVPDAVVLDGSNPYIKDHETEYGPHGYVSLEFENGKLTEIMQLADGTEVMRNQIA
ncbi:MAG: metallophosphoesterase [Bryobacterales bacterium]|nr:metallophosphoesterase [Bryobacterales bacterium]